MQLEMDFNQGKHVVVSLSGGMDSSTLLLKAIKDYNGNVTALSFNYGQKHVVELERAQSLVDYLNANGYNIKYRQIKLDGLVDLLNSALVEGGEDVPEGHYEEENMKATVVPNRNKIFASITQAVALSVATSTKEKTDIALGIHAGDHAIYPDCRQEWRDADDHAFRMGNWDSELVGYYTPYLETDKFGILQDGQELCDYLELEFDEVYKRTNTSYKPLQFAGIVSQEEVIGNDNTKLGTKTIYNLVWYSDYKSASSVERIEAFLKLGRPDPVAYADETGPVSWEVAKTHVEKVLAEHER